MLAERFYDALRVIAPNLPDPNDVARRPITVNIEPDNITTINLTLIARGATRRQWSYVPKTFRLASVEDASLRTQYAAALSERAAKHSNPHVQFALGRAAELIQREGK